MQSSQTIRRRGLATVALLSTLFLGLTLGPTTALAEENDAENISVMEVQEGSSTDTIDGSSDDQQMDGLASGNASTDQINVTVGTGDSQTQEDLMQAPDEEANKEETGSAEGSEEELTNLADDQDAEGENQNSDVQPIADGTYVISSKQTRTTVLDVKSNSNEEGANVQAWTTNASEAQSWDIKYCFDGYYTIFKTGTDMVLAVVDGEAEDGANVGLAKYQEGDDSQLWSFVEVATDFYNIVSRLDPTFVLNLAGGSTNKGTNVDVSTNTNAATQAFRFYSTAPASASTVNLANGTYEVKSCGNSNYSLDIKSGSTDSGANTQIYKANGTQAQMFHFDSDGEGYYVISVVKSGKVLSVQNAVVIPSNNVSQVTYTGSDLQKWAIHKTEYGYVIVNKATNLVLDVSGGKYENGINIQGYTRNNTVAQSFYINKTYALSNGIYKITSLKATSKALDVEGASTSNGATIRLWTYNNSYAQKYEVQRVSNDGEELYLIRTAASGGYLTYTDDKVTQYGNHETEPNDSNLWSLVWNGLYYSMKNVATGKVLDLKSGKTDNGTVIQLWNANGTVAQHFFFDKVNLIIEGTYFVKTSSGTVLDVKSGSKDDGQNIQTWGKNNTVAQRFIITPTSSTSNTYTITNRNSGLVVTVAGASHATEANVQQNKGTKAKSQQWVAHVSDGGTIMFVNVESGKTLTVHGGDTAAGNNVEQNETTENSTQRWKLQPVEWLLEYGKYNFYNVDGKSTSWNQSSYDTWKKIQNMTSETDYLGAVDRARTYTTFYIKRYGVWEPTLAFVCAVGAGSTPTPTGTFKIWYKSRHEYWTDENGTTSVWYWSNFGPDGEAFHSVLTAKDNPNVVTYGALGKWNSHGCVRCPMDIAKWIYNNAKKGTTVYVY